LLTDCLLSLISFTARMKASSGSWYPVVRWSASCWPFEPWLILSSFFWSYSCTIN
jgi:hypothetical protein